uniref:VWFA domain-containing protein n=1 Tax=Clytia hemisphaerica TaxID=252671 RepID=A0A7M5WVJ2_9CNID
TRIDKALRLTQSQMFSIANGGRPGVSKIVIVLTDGSQTQDVGAEDPGNVAEELRSMGYKVLAVGIGSGVNSTELAHITGNKANVYSAVTFDELISQDFLGTVNKAGCDEAKKEVKPLCEVKVDVGFVLDSSGSLRNDYDKEKNFLKALAATFGVSEDGARAGVVTFSYDTEHSIKLNDHYDLFSFSDAVDKIPLMGHTTRIDKALRLTQSQMFSIANGGRPGVSKIVIVLTDGSQTQDVGAEDPGNVAEELRSMGYKVLA